MAKAKGTAATALETTRETVEATEHKIEDFAEDIGKLLGSARNKAEGWIGQRRAIVKHLEEVRDAAADLLTQLGHQAETVVRRARIGRPPGSTTVKRRRRAPVSTPAVHRLIGRPPGTVKRKSGISAAGRKAISDAQKARWAAIKASGRKK
jgi:hypothetical protein